MSESITVDSLKRCSKCKRMKELCHFCHDSKQGQQRYCRQCFAEYNRTWRARPEVSPETPDASPSGQHLYILTFEDELMSRWYGCKIGKSKDPEVRAAQLTQSLPFELQLIATFPDKGYLEQMVHEELAEHQVKSGRSREWFKLQPYEAVAKVAGIIARSEEHESDGATS